MALNQKNNPHSFFFHEAHFACLPHKSNVYLLSNLRTASGYSKVLVAPIKGKAVTVEYMQSRGEFKPEEVEFAYIPGEGEGKFTYRACVCAKSEF